MTEAPELVPSLSAQSKTVVTDSPENTSLTGCPKEFKIVTDAIGGELGTVLGLMVIVRVTVLDKFKLSVAVKRNVHVWGTFVVFST